MVIGPLLMKPYMQQAGGSGGPAPTCVGRYGGSEVVTLHGKVVARTIWSYTVIK
jgi:hypothetical protein